jgi:LysM repeat protein
VGFSALRNSTLLQKLNQKDYVGASNEFDRWIHAGGKVLAGLVERRKTEKALYLKPDPQPVVKPKVVTQYYTIKKGYNLTHISEKYKTTVSRLLKLNPQIHNANKIYVGQKIKIKG